MKKIILSVSLLVALVGKSHALTTAYTSPLYNGPISSTQTINFDLNANRVDFLSVTAAYSSTTLATDSFTDGSKSTGTISPKTISALSAVASSDTITVSTNSALAATQGTQSILVSSNGATALLNSTITINSSQIFSGVHFTVGASSNTTAQSIAAAINSFIPNVTASVVPVGGGTVTITCANVGSFCNTYTIKTSTIALLTSTGTVAGMFTGGNDNSSFTITDPRRTFIFTQGVQWTAQAQSSNTAVSIINALNQFPFFFVASTSTSNTVLIQRFTKERVGNLFTLAASTGALTVGSTNFIGGQDAASFTLQGITKTAGIDWIVGVSSVTASTSIVTAINSDPFLSTIVIATTSVTCPGCGIVYTTSTVVGVNAWNLVSSSTSSLIVTGFSGGSASNVTTSNNSLNLASHGLANGTQVLFAKSAGTPPGTLISGTTYFAVVLDGNNIQLSTTLANATATPAVVVGISTQAVNGGGAFTLTPLAINSPMILTWNASDDGFNFNPLLLPNAVTVSAVTVQTTSAASSTYWDFGQINARILQLKIQGPATGAFTLTVTPYGKSQANGY